MYYNTNEEDIGSCNRSKRGVFVEKEKIISIIKRRERKDIQVY